MIGDNSSTEFKDKARVFWMVKGYLPDDRTIESAYPGYVKRLWWNEEAYLRADGFEEAWQERMFNLFWRENI